MNTINISVANANDVLGIVHVRRATWLATYPNVEANITCEDIEEANNKRTVAEECERVQDRIENNSRCRTWVAKVGDRVVGFATAVRESPRNRIGAIYIVPEYQGKGIGSQLLSNALVWLGNGKEICFEVVAYNTKSIAFYKKFGFRENGVGNNPVGNLPGGKVLPEIEMIKEAGDRI